MYTIKNQLINLVHEELRLLEELKTIELNLKERFTLCDRFIAAVLRSGGMVIPVGTVRDLRTAYRNEVSGWKSKKGLPWVRADFALVDYGLIWVTRKQVQKSDENVHDELKYVVVMHDAIVAQMPSANGNHSKNSIDNGYFLSGPRAINFDPGIRYLPTLTIFLVME